MTRIPPVSIPSPQYEQEGDLCPECNDGTVIIRQNKTTDEDFLGCTNWPSCNFISEAICLLHPPGTKWSRRYE